MPVGNGHFQLTTEGFSQFLSESLRLDADPSRELTGVLAVGLVTESSTVTGAEAEVETVGGILKEIVGERRITAIPLARGRHRAIGRPRNARLGLGEPARSVFRSRALGFLPRLGVPRPWGPLCGLGTFREPAKSLLRGAWDRQETRGSRVEETRGGWGTPWTVSELQLLWDTKAVPVE